MAIVTYHYRPKRAPRKTRPAIANRIVTPAKLRPIKGPVIRLRDQAEEPQPKRSAIVTPKRRTSIFGNAPDLTEEELQRRGRGPTRCGGNWCAGRVSDLPTARTMLKQAGWLCQLVWCKACHHQAPADLQPIIDSGRGDVPLKDLKFRCTACGSRKTDSVVMALDALRVQPWH